jgi:type II secretory pathway component PulC
MRSLVSALAALALGLHACGGASPAAPASPVSAPSAAASPRPVAGVSGHTVARSAIHAAIAQGLGAFLQRLDLDDKPVLVASKFHGFRIAALRDPPFWNGVDLKPGDVVTSVNGFPIERPEQAQAAFESLQVASELRVSYERDGEPRELVYSIVDER